MYPNSSVVAGVSMSDINDAILAAGSNGTVFFPAGTYEVDGLCASVPGWQTWVYQQGAKLIRSATASGPIINITSGSSLHIVGGEFDGNRANNPSYDNGIAANDGCDLKMSGGFIVRNVSAVGIWGRDGEWDIRDGKVIDTGIWGIYWAAVTFAPGNLKRQAPKIKGVMIDRSREPKTSNNGGGICLNGGPTNIIQTCENAEIRDNTILLPTITNAAQYNTLYDSVAVEANYCYMPILSGNRVSGGRIGISTQTCPWAVQSFNQGCSIGDYMIEMVNCEFGSAVGNVATGAGPSIAHYGISISGTASKGLNITGNNCKMMFATPINIAPGASGGGYAHTISGNN